MCIEAIKYVTKYFFFFYCNNFCSLIFYVFSHTMYSLLPPLIPSLLAIFLSVLIKRLDSTAFTSRCMKLESRYIHDDFYTNTQNKIFRSFICKNIHKMCLRFFFFGNYSEFILFVYLF